MTWGYDELDRITQAVTPQGSIGYSYDAAGRRTGMTPAAQAAVSYAYDNANRLSSITQGSEIVQFAYDNGNRRTQLILPNGVTVAYGYDDGDQLTGLNYKQGNGTALGDLSYSYDIAGRVTGQGGSLAFNQLPAPTTQPSTFDANNRQTSFNGATLTYDANGNLTSDGTNTFEWNARDQLVKVMQGGTPKLSYSYDAMGRRISKTVDAATPTQYLYDGDNAVQEQAGAAVNPILAGLGIDERFARNDVTGRTYFLADMLGSTIGLADAAGQIKQQYRYDPYGNVSQTDTTSGFTNPYQYTGREADTAGLYYYRARYYSPGMGRFISEDPVQFAGGQANLYGFVYQSPLNYVDPAGLAGQLSSPRVPPSHSWKQSPGPGGNWPLQQTNKKSYPGQSSVEQTPGAWGGVLRDTRFTYRCVSANCASDPMICRAGQPSRVPLNIVGTPPAIYPTALEMKFRYPTCQCEKWVLEEKIIDDSATGANPSANAWDYIEVAGRVGAMGRQGPTRGK